VVSGSEDLEHDPNYVPAKLKKSTIKTKKPIKSKPLTDDEDAQEILDLAQR
jgi:hypothetical protein